MRACEAPFIFSSLQHAHVDGDVPEPPESRHLAVSWDEDVAEEEGNSKVGERADVGKVGVDE